MKRRLMLMARTRDDNPGFEGFCNGMVSGLIVLAAATLILAGCVGSKSYARLDPQYEEKSGVRVSTPTFDWRTGEGSFGGIELYRNCRGNCPKVIYVYGAGFYNGIGFYNTYNEAYTAWYDANAGRGQVGTFPSTSPKPGARWVNPLP